MLKDLWQDSQSARQHDSHTASFKFIQLSTLRADETGTARSMLKVRWVLKKFYRARNSQSKTFTLWSLKFFSAATN